MKEMQGDPTPEPEHHFAEGMIFRRSAYNRETGKREIVETWQAPRMLKLLGNENGYLHDYLAWPLAIIL